MSRHRAINGFTMVELIAIILLIGILAIVALPRFFSPAAFNVRGQGDQVQAMVRQAQKIAIAQNRDVFVIFNGTSVVLCTSATCATRVLSSSNAPMGLNLPSNVNLTIQPTVQNTGFHFNALGQPLQIGNSISSNFSRMTISLTSSGETQAFFVENETGYVHQ